MSPKRIKENLEAAQSRSFTICLADGQKLKVPHTDYVLLAPDGLQMALFTGGSTFKLVDTAHITSMEFTRPSSSKKSSQKS